MSSSIFFPSSSLLSDGANNFVYLLNPGQRPSGTAKFPTTSDWRDTTLRFSGTESLGDWFRRIIGPHGNAINRINSCQVDDGLALFGDISWDNDGIYFIGLQALVIEGGSLHDFYDNPINKELRPHYYRLDLDISKIGEIFKEPLPHLHCVPNGAPRVHFNPNPDHFLPISFVEFIYLNHFHEKWKAWAKSEVLNHDDKIPFDRIVSEYKLSNRILLVSQFRNEIANIRTALFEVKKSHAPNPRNLNPCIQVLNYF